MQTLTNITRAKSKELADEALAARIATQAVAGIGLATIADNLSETLGVAVDYERVRRIFNTESCRRFMRDLTNEAMASAKAHIRIETTKLAKEVVKVLTHHLKNNNLNAVPIVVKIMGIGDEQEQKETSQSLTVILPGADTSKAAIEINAKDMHEGE